MNPRHLILPLALLLLAACKKETTIDGDPAGNSYCGLIAVHKYGGRGVIRYNADSSVQSVWGSEYTYYNGGSFAEAIGRADTAELDGSGRLYALHLPWDNDKRQLRTFEYDATGQIIRTHTNTGDGLNYLVDLTWQNGDVVDYVFNVAGQGMNHDHFTFTYYDTLAPDRFTRLNWINQVGTVMSRHLLKRSLYEADTTYYSYRFDSLGRIAAIYRDYDNTDWVWKRAVDTTVYEYGCY